MEKNLSDKIIDDFGIVSLNIQFLSSNTLLCFYTKESL